MALGLTKTKEDTITLQENNRICFTKNYRIIVAYDMILDNAVSEKSDIEKSIELPI